MSRPSLKAESTAETHCRELSKGLISVLKKEAANGSSNTRCVCLGLFECNFRVPVRLLYNAVGAPSLERDPGNTTYGYDSKDHQSLTFRLDGQKHVMTSMQCKWFSYFRNELFGMHEPDFRKSLEASQWLCVSSTTSLHGNVLTFCSCRSLL